MLGFLFSSRNFSSCIPVSGTDGSQRVCSGSSAVGNPSACSGVVSRLRKVRRSSGR